MNTTVRDAVLEANRARFVLRDAELEDLYKSIILTYTGSIPRSNMFRDSEENLVYYYAAYYMPNSDTVMEIAVNPLTAVVDADGSLRVYDLKLFSALTGIPVSELT